MALDALEADRACHHLVKVIFLGDAAVGKTSLIERLFSDRFNPNTEPTIGVDFRFKRYVVDGQSIGVTLWDTAGAERFSALTASYFRGAHGIVLVYDVTRRETFASLESHWLDEVSKYVNTPGVVKLIVGNKVDLEVKRAVSSEEGVELAKRFGCLYKETSTCADDENVHDALVWGLLSSVVDNEQLLRSHKYDKLQVEQKGGHGQNSSSSCC